MPHKFSLVPGTDGERLGCDCYGGCWGDHSRNWPGLRFEDEQGARLGWRLCHQEREIGVTRPKDQQVGHGNYVFGSDNVLRFATKVLRNAHAMRLRAMPEFEIEALSLELGPAGLMADTSTARWGDATADASEAIRRTDEAARAPMAHLLSGTDLPIEAQTLQRRVQPFGWDVEALAPDLAVPHLELLRRDGKVKVLLQRAGTGWAIEIGFRREVVRRGFGKGPEYSAVEWDEQVLRFDGRAQLDELQDALRVVAQIVSENGLIALQGSTRGALETGNGERGTATKGRS